MYCASGAVVWSDKHPMRSFKLCVDCARSWMSPVTAFWIRVAFIPNICTPCPSIPIDIDASCICSIIEKMPPPPPYIPPRIPPYIIGDIIP